MTFEKPRILLVDSYDSFTFNLAALCRTAIPHCVISIIKNDDYTMQELLPHLGCFSAVVIGPGPGSPENVQDIGIVRDLWTMEGEDLLPIFGVCLGLQSMAIAFGAHLGRLRVVKHGQVSDIQHDGIDIFQGVQTVHAVRYHSLHVTLPKDGDLQELAWADDGEENGHVVMAAKHRSRPFWAVQYHPESVCTEGGGLDVLRNFWRLARNWTLERGRTLSPWNGTARDMFCNPWPHIQPHSPPPTLSQSQPAVATVTLDLPGLSVVTACERLGVFDESLPFVLLDSAAKPGRFSIIGLLLPTSPQITHYVNEHFVNLRRGEKTVREDLKAGDVWSWLATFMKAHKAQGYPEIPFWGGLVGQLSYELGVHSLRVPLNRNAAIDGDRHPDVNLVFVERSVVLDSVTGKAYVQSLIPKDDSWLTRTKAELIAASSQAQCSTSTNKTAVPPVVTFPVKSRYISRINDAKEHLYAGESYEICLTAHTRISVPVNPSGNASSWEHYKSLRQNNPAPHSAYLRLHPTTLLSSSPERFLSFSRPPRSICQLRPIKGTVRKAQGVTRAVAEELLVGSAKEVAENLMIVDLIRHDLHGVVGEDVQVKQFCGVEEYETVWQLVSVIEGRLSQDSTAFHDPDYDVGWEVLRRSLPPGSMTGAPKKRSVEILQTLEDHDRSIYSGVLGYWCVGGGGDWAVTIRSCFKYQSTLLKDSVRPSREEWIVGAGGAITALSDAEAEWEEMIVKLQSVLRSFEMK
ncbi:para-aminobenzoate synthase [Tricholoma matsutake]|nr:para-aminobenzoate synthase [Tricholoma matsutake 945]